MATRRGVLLVLVGVATLGGPTIAAQEGRMSTIRPAPTVDPSAQCTQVAGDTEPQPTSGRSHRNGVSPPLASITPGLPATPSAIYTVPRLPAPSCEASPAATVSPAAVAVLNLSPASGPIGTAVAISGTGFTADDNAILFGMGYIPHLRSLDGATLTFEVPGSLDPACLFVQPIPCRLPSYATRPGTYEVAVSNSNGTSNSASFAVVAGADEPASRISGS